jgi:hypothetical protein
MQKKSGLSKVSVIAHRDGLDSPPRCWDGAAAHWSYHEEEVWSTLPALPSACLSPRQAQREPRSAAFCAAIVDPPGICPS